MLVLQFYYIILFQLTSFLIPFKLDSPFLKISFALAVIFVFVIIAKWIQKKIMKEENH